MIFKSFSINSIRKNDKFYEFFSKSINSILSNFDNNLFDLYQGKIIIIDSYDLLNNKNVGKQFIKKVYKKQTRLKKPFLDLILDIKKYK